MKNIAVRNDKRLDKESKWNNVNFTPHNVVRKNSTYFKEEITTKTSCFLKEEDVFILAHLLRQSLESANKSASGERFG
jgi:hypothetical protein